MKGDHVNRSHAAFVRPRDLRALRHGVGRNGRAGLREPIGEDGTPIGAPSCCWMEGIVMLDKRSTTRSALMLLAVSAGLMALACAHSPAPMRVRYADIDKGAMKGFTGAQPLIIEFQPGDRIPVNFELTGEGFELEPRNPPLELVVKRHYFLRIGADGFRLSTDPEHFDDKPRHPGTFQVGFWVDRAQRAKVNVVISAPRR